MKKIRKSPNFFEEIQKSPNMLMTPLVTYIHDTNLLFILTAFAHRVETLRNNFSFGTLKTKHISSSVPLHHGTSSPSLHHHRYNIKMPCAEGVELKKKTLNICFIAKILKKNL